MIQIYKLEKLHRNQRLRKIAKYFSFAEKRLNEYCLANKNPEIVVNIFSINELTFFFDAVKLLAKDEQFSTEMRKVFEQAIEVFNYALTSNNNPSPQSLVTDPCSPQTLLRTLNNVKHLLLLETGSQIADWDFTTDSGALDITKRRVFPGMHVYLEDIRSPFNVGAMFRTAESFGVEKIILSPFCADPRHRRAERTAMGCIDIVTWERLELFPVEVADGQQLQLPVFALETGGVPIGEFDFPPCGIMIAGSEELGVSPRALAAADASLGRVSIPLYGVKASLNVSTAFGIALQAWAQCITK